MVHVLHQSIRDVWFFVTSAALSIFSMQCHADVSMYRVETKQQIDGGYRSYASKFGPPIGADGFDGLVTYNSSDGTGCNSSLILPPPSIFTNHRWILLLQRGNCSFVEKVRNAQNKLYEMVIVFNNASSVDPMYAKDAPDILIPSVFVSQHTGLTIKNKYQYFHDVFVIVDDPNFPFDMNPELLLPFAVVVAVCFITMISFMICKYIRDRRRRRRHRLPVSSLREIPIQKYSSKTCRFETCAICLEDYVQGEKLRILPCTHAYHTKCIDPWLTRNRRVCPICKRRVFAASEVPVDSSESDSDSDNDERTPLVRSEDPQGAERRAFSFFLINSLFASRRQSSPEEQESTNGNNNSDTSYSTASSTSLENHVIRPAQLVCSINSPDSGLNPNAVNPHSYPGTSSLQLPHHSRSYNVQNHNDIAS